MSNEAITRRLKIYINGEEVDATITNLRKNLAKFRAQANQAVEGTPEWKKYNKEVARTEVELKAAYQAQRQFKDATVLSDKGLSSMQSNLKKTNGILGGFKKVMGDIFFPVSGALLFTDAIKGGIRYVKEFIGEAIQLSIEAKGVEYAFKRLGDEGESAFLRVKAATRGLLSDLEIKRSLVEFDNFNISLEESATLFEFLSVRATQTGESVDYLKSSLVEGLSKQSKLRIDNLGISTAKLNEELKKTPNFVQAVANIAKTEIARAGNVLDDAASSSQQFNAALENTKLRIGNLINNSGVLPFFQKLGTSILNTLTPSEKMVSSIEKQQTSLNSLVTSIIHTNENTEQRKILLNELTDKYPFFLQFLKDEKTDNDSLTTALGEVNKLYIKRLAIQQLESDLNIEGKKKEEARQTGELAKAERQRQEVLDKINLKLFKGTIIGKDADEQSKKIKDALLSSEIKLTQLQDKRTDAQNRTLLNIQKARNLLLESEKIAAGVSSKKGFAASDLTAAEQKVAEIEKRLGLTKDQLDGVFSQDAVVISNKKNTPEEQAKIDAFKKGEEEITKIIDEQRKKRQLSQLKGLDKQLAEIDQNYQVQIDKYIGHDDKIKELEALRDQEKADLKVQREAELQQRLKDLDEQNRLEAESQRLDREAEQAVTDEEKTLILLEKTRFIANEQLRIEEEKQKEKLRLEGATQQEIDAIHTQFLLKRKKVEDTYNKGKNLADKQALENEKTLNAQRTAAYASMFGSIAQLLGKNTAAGKAAGIAQATINTYQGVTEVWSTKSALLEPFATISRIVNTGVVLASGLAAVKQISATKTPSLAKGGDTFSGPYSGGVDGIGGQYAILHPDEYVIPKYVRQDPEVPRIIEYLEAKRKQKTPSFATGGNVNTQPSPTSPTPSNNDAVMAMLAQAVNKLVDEGVQAHLNYSLTDEINRQDLEKKLKATKLASKN